MTSSRARPQRDDEGFALLTVLIGMLALTGVVLATLAYVVNSLPVSRAGQDAAAAVQAAQAGVDDYLARLATCDAYWQTPCAGSTVSPAVAGWATVPDSPAQYHYEVVKTPNDEAGLLRLRSTGRVMVAGAMVKRTLVVDLRKRSLLDYVYYTDKEALDPEAVLRRYPTRVVSRDPAANSGYNAHRFLGVTPAEAAKCGRYYYTTNIGGVVTPGRESFSEGRQRSRDGGATWETWTPVTYGCEIQFANVDVIDGPSYTQDAALVNGPLFKGPMSTRWPASSTPAPNPSAWYRLNGAAPQAAGFQPRYDAEDVRLPPSNAAIKDRTNPALGDGVKGCPYTGPTRIVLKANATMDVTSPLTRSTNPGCGSVGGAGIATQTVSLPENGVIYVSDSTESCTGKSLGTYPIDGDKTKYDCFKGDVFLEGTVGKRLTIATTNNIVITEDVVYRNGLTGTESLGLIANGNVEVYHPVQCAPAPTTGYDCETYSNMVSGLDDITVSAAILSVQHSFTVQNFDKGARLGTLTVLGGIYQLQRGPVGTSGGSGGTGYAKDYRYDKRLKSLPPPDFLDPIAAPWNAKGYAEVDNPTGLPS